MEIIIAYMMLVTASLAFKGQFTYVGKLFTKATYLNVNLKYDVELLEHHITSILETYQIVYEKLSYTYNEIFKPMEMDHLPGYHVIPQAYYFHTARQQCKLQNDYCSLSVIKDKEDMEVLVNLMKKSSMHEIHLNYYSDFPQTLSYTDIYSEGLLIKESEYIHNMEVQTYVCPKEYILYNNRCIHIYNENRFSWELAVSYCAHRNSSLFSMNRANSIRDIKQITNGMNVKFAWVGHIAKHNKKKIKECIKLLGYLPYVLYSIEDECYFIGEDKFQGSVICEQEAVLKKYPPGFLKSFDYHYFASRYHKLGGSSISLKYPGILVISSKYKQLPSVCQCDSKHNYSKLVKKLQNNLKSKLDSTLENLTNTVYSLILQTSCSPYVLKSVIGNETVHEFKPIDNITISDKRRLISDILTVRKCMSDIKQHQCYNSPNFIVQIFISEIWNKMIKKESIYKKNQVIRDVKLSIDKIITAKITYDKKKSATAYANISLNYCINITSVMQMQAEIDSLLVTIDQIYLTFSENLKLAQNRIEQFMDFSDLIIYQKTPSDNMFRNIIYNIVRSLPRDYVLLEDSVLSSLKTATVNYTISDNFLISHLYIPIVKESTTLYLFKATPVPYFSGKYLPILPVFESEILGVTKFRHFVHLKASDLLSCKYKNNFLCNSIKLYERTKPSCMISHFYRNKISAARHCEFVKLEKPYFHISNNDIIYYHTPRKCKGKLLCQDYSENVTLTKLGEYYIEKGCNFTVNNITFVNAKVEEKSDIPSELLPKLSDEEIFIRDHDVPSKSLLMKILMLDSTIVITVMIGMIISFLLLILANIIQPYSEEIADV